jgi:hypothetical protein
MRVLALLRQWDCESCTSGSLSKKGSETPLVASCATVVGYFGVPNNCCPNGLLTSLLYYLTSFNF